MAYLRAPSQDPIAELVSFSTFNQVPSPLIALLAPPKESSGGGGGGGTHAAAFVG